MLKNITQIHKKRNNSIILICSKKASLDEHVGVSLHLFFLYVSNQLKRRKDLNST